MNGIFSVVLSVFFLLQDPALEEMMSIMQQAEKSKSEFEGDEAIFQPLLLQNGKKELDIIDSVEEKNETLSDLHTCEESGEYEKIFAQKLEITYTQKKVKKCLGHFHVYLGEAKGHTKSHLHKDTKKKLAELHDQYQNNPAIQKNFTLSSEEHKYHTDLFATYTHVDGFPPCDHYAENIVQEEKQERWETDDAESFNRIAQNPNCKLTLIQPVEGPQEKIVQGKTEFRDVWARNLFFYCSPEENSPCASLRKQGGILVSKRCKKMNDEEECEVWEKVFDLGQGKAPAIANTFAPGKRIWGLNQEITGKPKEPNHGLSSVRAILQIFSDLPQAEEERLLHLDEKMHLFNGEEKRCKQSKKIKEIFDCCNEMSGCIGCSEEEKKLRAMRDEERCHYVGQYTEGFLDLTRTRVFCCFPTKLLKIFNEQARQQVFGNDKKKQWGTPQTPRCAGFSLEEMDGKIDLSLMDFSSVATDFSFDENAIRKEIEEKMQRSLENTQDKSLFQEALHGHYSGQP